MSDESTIPVTHCFSCKLLFPQESGRKLTSNIPAGTEHVTVIGVKRGGWPPPPRSTPPPSPPQPLGSRIEPGGNVQRLVGRWTSLHFRFGFSCVFKVWVCGHRLLTFPLSPAVNETGLRSMAFSAQNQSGSEERSVRQTCSSLPLPQPQSWDLGSRQ